MSKRTERSPVPRDVKRCRRAAQWSLPDPMMEQVMSFCTYAELAPLLGLSRRWHAFARRALVARSQCYLVTRELAGVPPDVRRIIVPLTKADCGLFEDLPPSVDAMSLVPQTSQLRGTVPRGLRKLLISRFTTSDVMLDVFRFWDPFRSLRDLTLRVSTMKFLDLSQFALTHLTVHITNVATSTPLPPDQWFFLPRTLTHLTCRGAVTFDTFRGLPSTLMRLDVSGRVTCTCVPEGLQSLVVGQWDNRQSREAADFTEHTALRAMTIADLRLSSLRLPPHLETLQYGHLREVCALCSRTGYGKPQSSITCSGASPRVIIPIQARCYRCYRPVYRLSSKTGQPLDAQCLDALDGMPFVHGALWSQ